jgi:hypothetical protein
MDRTPGEVNRGNRISAKEGLANDDSENIPPASWYPREGPELIDWKKQWYGWPVKEGAWQ